jgi:hypothetical protein
MRSSRLGFVGCAIAVLLVSLLVLSQPWRVAAAGPTPSPAPSTAPQPAVPPVDQPVAGPAPATASVPSCGSAAPGLINVDAGEIVHAQVALLSASSKSDFELVSPTQRTLIPSNESKVNVTVTVNPYLAPTGLTFAIYTPDFGTTRLSTGPFAKVLAEGPGVWLICFEDGTDGDFNDLVVQVWDVGCASEHLIDLGTATDPVRVQYDPRTLWNPGDTNFPGDVDFRTKAAWMADAVRQRALVALDDYRTIFGAFGRAADVPPHIDIQLTCSPLFLGVVEMQDAITENASLVKLKASTLESWMADYVRDEIDPNKTPAVAGTIWAETIDHELMHTLQYEAITDSWLGLPGFWGRYLFNQVIFESTATVGQDLHRDVDDFVGDPALKVQDRFSPPVVVTFLDFVASFLSGHQALTQTAYNSNDSYSLAGFFQYLGERYGTPSLSNLEARVAEFDRRLYTGPTTLNGMAAAMGATSPTQVVNALRDFYLALYVRQAANATSLPARFRILDETTLHGAAPSYAQPDPALSWGTLGFSHLILESQYPYVDTATLAPTAAKVYEAVVPSSAALLKVTIADTSTRQVVNAGRFVMPGVNDSLRLGFVGKTGTSGDQVVLDPTTQQVGPSVGRTITYTIPAAGRTKIGIIAVAGRSPSRFTMTVEAVTGSVGLSIDPVGSVAAGSSVLAFVHPFVGSVPARLQPLSAYTATIDGAPAQVTASFDLVARQMLFVRPGSTLATGNHTLTLTFQLGTQVATASQTFEVTAGGGGLLAALAASAPVAIDALQVANPDGGGTPITIRAVLDQDGVGLPGATVTASVTDPVGRVRTFVLGDDGGEFDSAAGDGAYGAAATGTSVAGTYTVRVDATGVDGSGTPYSVTTSTTVAIAPMTDSDGDGIPDSVETALGLNPADPTDGMTDLDGDGVGTAAEIAAGSNPLLADTDGGGESDGSEIAAGRDPLAKADDHLVPTVAIAAAPIAGRQVQVSVSAGDGATPIHVYRASSAGSVDLGVHAGAGETFADGPLAVGSYQYAAIGEAANGGQTAPASTSVVVARDDATPPSGRMILNDGRGLINTPVAAVAFVDLTETPTQMRLAESADALAAAAWVPYQAQTSFTVGASGGTHTIYAQLVDGAGNSSAVITQSFELDLTGPSSAAGPLPAWTLDAGVWVPFVASDDHGIGDVELWTRYRATATAAWSSWRLRATEETSPIWCTFDSGFGYYEFATSALDTAGNQEALPAAGDAAIRYGPEAVNDDTGSATQSSPRSTTGLDGNVYAVWSDARNSSTVYDIYFARRTAVSGTWGVNERVDDSTATATTPAVAVDSAGNAYAVWVDARRGDQDIWFSKRSAATGVWSPSVRVNDDVAGSVQNQPEIAISSTGEAIAVWVDGRSKKAYVYSARLPAGATQWSANIRASSDSLATKGGPDVTIGANGTAYATWTQTKNGTSTIRFATLAAGATAWAADVLLSDASRSQLGARIGVDATGALLVTYQDGSVALWARYRPAGSATWSTPAYVSTTTDAFGSSLAVRGSGVGYVAWTDINNQLYGARYDPLTHTWATQQTITTSGNHYSSSVALDSTTAVIVTQDYANNTYDIRAYPAPVP